MEAIEDWAKYGMPPSDYQRAPDLLDDYPENQVLWLTGEELRSRIQMDPDWIRKYATKETPVGITTPADLSKTKITGLSPYIAFRGVSWKKGDDSFVCATFERCENLESLEGTFHGNFRADRSGVKEIKSESLKVFRVSPVQNAVSFSICKNLTVARGTFPAGVDFQHSPIREIDTHPETGLVITGPDNKWTAAYFDDCEELKTLKGRYPGKVVADRSGITHIPYNESDPDNPDENLIITRPGADRLALSIKECLGIKKIKLQLPGGLDMSKTNVEWVDMLKLPSDNLGPHDHPTVKLEECEKLRHVPPELLHSPNMSMDIEQRRRIMQSMEAAKRGRHVIKNADRGLEL